MRLYFCITPGATNAIPATTTLHATPYKAAVHFLENHPDFKLMPAGYMGKRVYEGQEPTKLYDYCHGDVEVETAIETVGDVAPNNQLVYRELSYDDFVSGLPVMTVRVDK